MLDRRNSYHILIPTNMVNTRSSSLLQGKCQMFSLPRPHPSFIRPSGKNAQRNKKFLLAHLCYPREQKIAIGSLRYAESHTTNYCAMGLSEKKVLRGFPCYVRILSNKRPALIHNIDGQFPSLLALLIA